MNPTDTKIDYNLYDLPDKYASVSSLPHSISTVIITPL